MDKCIAKFRKRRYDRLVARGIRADADWKENDHPRDENGQFASGGGGSSGAKAQSTPKQEAKAAPTRETADVKFGGAKPKKFVAALGDAKESMKEAGISGSWRVTEYSSGEEFAEEHPGAKMHTTNGGSTIAVTPEGDIVAVCHKTGDPTKGKDLIEMAAKNGGKKLDSYDGNYGFYLKCGFEPVSWCKWDGDYAPDDWDAGKDKPENIIFFKHTGKQSQYKTKEDFYNAVKASDDYGAAQAARDKEVG